MHPLYGDDSGLWYWGIPLQEVIGVNGNAKLGAQPRRFVCSGMTWWLHG
jgi:hypothetical protein